MNLAYAQVCQQEKVGDYVDFPVQNLDVSSYIQDKSIQGPIYYDLYAVSNHYGSLNGGHYTAFCYNALAGKWYDFNDSAVSSASLDEIVSNGAYLLFYRRRD
jgi:ubiquitin C-terminal hydrolase